MKLLKRNEIINNSLKSQMTSYCLKCKKNTENINPKVLKTNNGKTMLLSKFALCGSKKSRFIKKQEATGKVLKHH